MNKWNFRILYQSEMFDFQMRQKPVGDQSLSQKEVKSQTVFHTNERWIGPSLLLC